MRRGGTWLKCGRRGCHRVHKKGRECVLWILNASEQSDQILTQSGCQLLVESGGHFQLNSLVVRGFRWGRMYAMILLVDVLAWAATLG